MQGIQPLYSLYTVYSLYTGYSLYSLPATAVASLYKPDKVVLDGPGTAMKRSVQDKFIRNTKW